MTGIHSREEELLASAAALALGALEYDEALSVCRELERSSENVIKEYQDMVWTTHHLPAALPLVSPPDRLKGEILQAIRAGENNRNSDSDDERDALLSAQYQRRAKADFEIIRADEKEWLPYPAKGISVAPLATDDERGYAMILMRLEPMSVFPSHPHSGAEQCFVVAGDIRVAEQELTAGSFFSVQAGSDHGDITTQEGATVLLALPLNEYAKSSWKVFALTLKRKFRAALGLEEDQ